MDKDDREFILDAINKRPQKADVYDHVSKIAVTICSAGILYLANVTVRVQQDIALIQQSQQIIKEEVVDLNKFTEKPRFTKEDYIEAEKQQNEVLRKLNEELIRRRDWMEDAEDKFTDMDRRLHDISRDIEGIHKAIDK